MSGLNIGQGALSSSVERGCEHHPGAKPNNHSTWPVQKDRAQRELKKTAVGLSRATFASVALSL